MKFLTDGMLGKLTRWLRLAGQDVVYVGELKISSKKQDLYLIRKAKREGRTLLTKDLELYRRACKAGVKTLFLRANTIPSMLREISLECGRRIEINPENSRCPMCNGRLRKKNAEEVEGVLPRPVLEGKKVLWVCSECGKIYWKGKHWENISKVAEEIWR
ncbi:MAG: hypothetical protein DSO02_02280 [Hadesarchaea archaeon]|nr:MAG: hypothetical protein DSO03_00030 [Hadesarchaea archaeon]TDA34612.1 MAG: hypothetical protein DSO02_02280 [Hadesarchaea archaeon]